MKTRKQIIREAKKRYVKGVWSDIMLAVTEDYEDENDVVYTEDGRGAWVTTRVWVSLMDPPRHRNGKFLKP